MSYLKMERQYIKDLSYECSDKKLTEESGKPKVSVKVDVGANKVAEQDDLYRVTLKVDVNADCDDGSKLFICELSYVGEFSISDIKKEEDLEQVLLILCPQSLFPYVARIIRDVTHDGAFSPVNIDHIEFATLYHDSKKRQQEQAAGNNEQQEDGSA